MLDITCIFVILKTRVNPNLEKKYHCVVPNTGYQVKRQNIVDPQQHVSKDIRTYPDVRIYASYILYTVTIAHVQHHGGEQAAGPIVVRQTYRIIAWRCTKN